MSHRRAVAASLLVALAPGAGAAETLFRDVAADSGITFTHTSTPEKKYILESMSGGVAVFDFDNDGLLDIYLVDALTVDTASDPMAANSALYKNLGDWRFTDVAEQAGVEHPGWGMGACVGDADGDGWRDLYVTNYGDNRLYRNNGDGTFTDIAAAAGVVGGGWSAGCGFADYDRDGDLDLFVSRYVEISLDELPVFGKDKTCLYHGVAVQCGPRGLPGTGDLLYRNDGGGRFTEVSKEAGVLDPEGYFGMGIAWADFDGDGWLDLFVANDSTPNFLYMNQGDGTFREDAFPMGVAVSEDGSEQGGMGVAVGDYDNSGRLSLFVTNFAEEYNALFQNTGTYFKDISFRSQTAPSSLPYVGWGTAFFDYDNNGLLDLMVVNGHVYPQLDGSKLGASAPYRQPWLLYRNRGDSTFEEAAGEAGGAFEGRRVSRGLAIADLDNDGRMDAVINDLDGAPHLLRNELAGSGHWLRVELRGAAANLDAIGARVTVTAAGRTQAQVVRSGTGYLSQDDMRLHFGLGDATSVDSVVVLWPDGRTSHKEGVAVDQPLFIEEPEP